MGNHSNPMLFPWVPMVNRVQLMVYGLDVGWAWFARSGLLVDMSNCEEHLEQSDFGTSRVVLRASTQRREARGKPQDRQPKPRLRSKMFP